MSKAFFVTGTDTEVGKTRISEGLIAAFQQKGLKTAGMKPIASGCEWINQQLQNEDAITLMQQADVDLPYSIVNPYAFEPAIAPHIAASDVDVEISLEKIEQSFQQIVEQADAVIVEGAGGWMVPINRHQSMADIAIQLKLPVILVVDIRLGCINHALLTVAAINQAGIPLAGWVANHTQSETQSAAIIDSLQQRILAPCLGVVPTLSKGQSAVAYLNIEELN